jgi:NADH-quinone oxidoreductase subunit I
MDRKDSRVVDVAARADALGAGVEGMAAGFAVTLKNMVRSVPGRNTVTIQYPEQRKSYSRRFRGIHVLTVREDGRLKCVACYLCATACPAECITIEADASPDNAIEKVAKRYEIDLSRCIFCGFCVDACPEEALAMTREYDLTTFDRVGSLEYGIEALTKRPEIAAYGAGYRPHMQYPLVESYLPTELTGGQMDGSAEAEE